MLAKAFINLGAIVGNAKKILKILPKTTKFCAVVKSDAYGHGLERVASALYPYCHCFAVANIYEAVRLRRVGIDKQILVLLPYKGNFLKSALHEEITLSVQSLQDLRFINSLCLEEKLPCKVHIKFNSGMNRFGADLTELEKMVKFAKDNRRIIIDGLFTHYAKPENDCATNQAKGNFLLAINLVKHYNKRVTCHISSSGGFLRGDYMDMVRIGILLYGYKPFESDLVKLAPAMSVYAPFVNCHDLSVNDGCLYGLKHPDKPTPVSILAYGYADGLPRREVGVQFNNKCMDAFAVKGSLNGFAPVMLNADALAKEYGTISYEVLTKCAIRAEKIYYYLP